jgi:hypothetical protein
MRRLGALLVAVGLVAAGCGGEEVPEGASLQGVVVDIEGDLTEVTSFTVVDASGERFTFLPSAGLTFEGEPLSHLSAHVTSGEPVLVGYEEGDGTLIATSVRDG